MKQIQINVLTSKNTFERIEYAKKTWLLDNSQVDIIYYSDFSDENNNIIKVSDDSTYRGCEERVVERLKQIKNNNIYNWYFFVDDDTYVNIINLNKFIDNCDKNIVYGRKCNGWGNLNYAQGGAGILISKENFDNISFNTIYKRGSGYSDVIFGQIIEDNNIKTEYYEEYNTLFHERQYEEYHNKYGCQRKCITFHQVKTLEDFSKHKKYYEN